MTNILRGMGLPIRFSVPRTDFWPLTRATVRGSDVAVRLLTIDHDVDVTGEWPIVGELLSHWLRIREWFARSERKEKEQP